MRSKKAFFNIGSSMILQIVTIISGFVLPHIYISNYGSAMYGMMSSIGQFLSYIVLLETGIGGAVRALLYKPLAKKDNNVICSLLYTTEFFFKKIALVFVLYMIAIAFFYPFISNSQFDWLFTFTLVIIIGISIFAQYYFGITYTILLNADQKSYIPSIVQIVTIIVNTAIMVLLALNNANILVLRLVSSLVFIVRPLFLNLYVKHKYNLTKKHIDHNFPIKQRWNALFHQAASFLRLNTDIVLLTIFTNLSEVSVYSIYSMITLSLENITVMFVSNLDALFGNMLAKNEHESLKKTLCLTEFMLSMISIILFTCAFRLITPFVYIYTIDINDAEYIRNELAYLFLVSRILYCIAVPYYLLIQAAGHYKETQSIALIETIIKITISIILVNSFEIIGLMLGSIFSMLYRLIRYAIYVNKKIISVDMINFIKKQLITIFTIIFILVIFDIIFPTINTENYLEWIVVSLKLITVSSIVSIITGVIFYFAEIRFLLSIAKKILMKTSAAQRK